MFENIQNKLSGVLKNLKGKGKLTEANIAQALGEIEITLLDADVNYKITKEFISNVREKAIGQKVLLSIEPHQLIIKIIYDELVQLMGEEQVDINLLKDPSIILVMGLQGSGKTTFCCKLAHFLKKKKNKNPILIAADIYRDAAIEQLKSLGEQISVPVFSSQGGEKPLDIVKEGISHAKEKNHNVIIIDTAGRLTIDESMMKEIKEIYDYSTPSESLFVLDAMTGQDAIETAQRFNQVIDYDGVVLTKLDGDTKGGAALTVRKSVGKPIKFISSGEKPDTLDLFHPDRIASRILGRGDIISLVEKAQEQFDEEEAKKIHKKISKGFDLNDFLEQIVKIEKMGNMKSLLSLIPGMGNFNLNNMLQENPFKDTKAIIYSMTAYERKNPDIIDHSISRINRIVKGSGTSIEKVKGLLKQFQGMSKLLKKAKGSSMKSLFDNIFDKK